MIYLASDHKGFELKEKIKPWLSEWDYDFNDLGPDKLDASDDYPDFIKLVGQVVSKDAENSRGIILGHSGQGEAIVANKYPNVRAAVFYSNSSELIKLSREHNDANVLSLGASFIDDETARSMIKLWLNSKFTEEERHVRRINKIVEIEKTLNK